MALYPPVIDYSMPAFSVEDAQENGVRIYFALSTLNSISSIETAHLTVKYQSNNVNALAVSAYPGKIKVCTINEVTADEDATRAATAERYYVTLDNSDLKNGFETGVTYKIQLRFSKDTDTTAGPLASYFTENNSLFSEWSTVCLIRGIYTPTVAVVGLEDETNAATEQASLVYPSIYPDFTVIYTPDEKSLDETLRRWRVQLYDADMEEVLAAEGWSAYTGYQLSDGTTSCSFEVNLPYEMTHGTSYNLVVDIETKNGYVSTLTREFAASTQSSIVLKAEVSAYIEEEDGYAKIEVAGLTTTATTANLTLRRASSKTNFTVWEDIANKTIINESLSWTYYDLTIESGVYYKYYVQSRDENGRRSDAVPSGGTDAIMGEFDSAFLTEVSGDKDSLLQLKLRYDFSISSANITIAESKVDTLGSAYPYIRRNGKMYYRTFSGSGLITSCMDNVEQLFADDVKIYGGYEDIANDFAAISNTVSLYANVYDYTHERYFRDLVSEFLYNSKPKLFRSAQEGNILVKLMSVSLSPKEELGRLFYSFSATFVEIGEPTIKNLDEHGIISIGTYSTDIQKQESEVLAVIDNNGEPFTAGEDVMSQIKDSYHIGSTYSEEDMTIINDFTINHLKIEVNSDPYIIDVTDDTVFALADDAGTKSDRDYILGWLFTIDGTQVVLTPPKTIYEVRDVSYTSDTSIIPAKDTQMSIVATSTLTMKTSTEATPSYSVVKKVNGQIFEVFEPSDNIVTLLKEKYEISFKKEFNINLVSVNTVEIEAAPGTAVLVKTTDSDEATRLEINETGILFIDPNCGGQYITSLMFDIEEGEQVEAIVNYYIQLEKEIY